MVSYCLGITRPIFLQISLSIILSFFLLVFFKSKIKNFILPFTLSLSFIFLGFLTFALFSFSKGYGFFASFKAQNSWDRVLGLHWNVIFQPKTVDGSDNVLNWDLQAFWLPILFFILVLFISFKNKVFSNNINLKISSQIKLDIIFLIALLYCCAHSAIQFLTYDLFFSTSRFIFAVPLFYYVLGKLLNEFNLKYKYYILIFYLIYSFSFFIYWWTRFAREAWMG